MLGLILMLGLLLLVAVLLFIPGFLCPYNITAQITTYIYTAHFTGEI